MHSYYYDSYKVFYLKYTVYLFCRPCALADYCIAWKLLDQIELKQFKLKLLLEKINSHYREYIINFFVGKFYMKFKL